MRIIQSGYKRSHPINIFEHTTKYLILLILPVLRVLLIGDISISAWLNGAWFDLIVIFVIFLLGFWAWYKYIYRVSDNGINIRKGIFLKKHRYISFNKLAVVSIERPFYLKPFSAVRINADTDGGNSRTADFVVTVNREVAEDFINKSKVPFITNEGIKKVYLPKNFYIALLSFVSSNSLTGVIFAATLISGSGKVLGSEFERTLVHRITEVMRFLVFGLPPAAAILGGAVLGGWLLSFILTLIRHLRFSATRQSGMLHIKSGIITNREYIIALKRTNLIEFRQTLITKLLGFFTVFIHSNGYGKRKDELSVLMPASGKNDLEKNLLLLLPEIHFSKNDIRPKIRYLSRFLIPPIAWILSVLAVFLIFAFFITGIDVTLLFFFIMFEAPCFWFLGVKIISYFHTGIGKKGSTYTLRYTYGYRIKTIVIQKDKCVEIILRRSLFQIMSGCCDLIIYSYSEGTKKHVIPNLEFYEAQKIMCITKYCRKPK